MIMSNEMMGYVYETNEIIIFPSVDKINRKEMIICMFHQKYSSLKA